MEQEQQQQIENNQSQSFEKIEEETGISFEQLLEKELQLQQQQQNNFVLVACEYCARKFNENSIEKHQKNCQKVFQQKRQTFKVKRVSESIEKLQQDQEQSPSVSPKNESKINQNSMESQESQRYQNCKTCDRRFHYSSLQKHEKCCERVFKNKRKVFSPKRMTQEMIKAQKNSRPQRTISLGLDRQLQSCQFCTRQFNEISYEKHVKICEKVFKTKRQPYKVQRMTDEMLESQKKSQSLENLKYDKVNDKLETCQSCERKFNEVAYEKHVKVCEKVFKQKREPYKIERLAENLLQAKKLSQEKKSYDKINDKLETCESCERKFNEIAYEKHVKVCDKVFKQKREVFKVDRCTETVENLGNQRSQSIENVKYDKVNDKLQSCQCCERKFNEVAYEKHVKVCEKVFKQKREPYKVERVSKQMLKAQQKLQEKNDKEHQNSNNDGRYQCQFCKRLFAGVTIDRHVKICGENASFKKNKRKPFDIKSKRLTEEQILAQKQKKQNYITNEDDYELPNSSQKILQVDSCVQTQGLNNDNSEIKIEDDIEEIISYDELDLHSSNDQDILNQYNQQYGQQLQEHKENVQKYLEIQKQTKNQNINKEVEEKIEFPQMNVEDKQKNYQEYLQKQLEFEKQQKLKFEQEQQEYMKQYILNAFEDKQFKRIQYEQDNQEYQKRLLKYENLDEEQAEKLNQHEVLEVIDNQNGSRYKYKVKIILMDKFKEILNSLIKAQNDEDYIKSITQNNFLLRQSQKVYAKKLLEIYEILLCKPCIAFVPELFNDLCEKMINNFTKKSCEQKIYEILKNACIYDAQRKALVQLIITFEYRFKKCESTQLKCLKIMQALFNKYEIDSFQLKQNYVINFLSEKSKSSYGTVRQVCREILEIFVQQYGNLIIDKFYIADFNKDILKSYDCPKIQEQNKLIEEEILQKKARVAKMKKLEIQHKMEQIQQKLQKVQELKEQKPQSKWREDREKFVNAIKGYKDKSLKKQQLQEKKQKQKFQDQNLQVRLSQQKQQQIDEIRKNKPKNNWREKRQGLILAIIQSKNQGAKAKIPKNNQYNFQQVSDERIAYIEGKNVSEESKIDEQHIKCLNCKELVDLIKKISTGQYHNHHLSLKLQNIALGEYKITLSNQFKEENKKLFCFKGIISDLTDGIQFQYFTSKLVFSENLLSILQLLSEQPMVLEIPQLYNQIIDLIMIKNNNFSDKKCESEQIICKFYGYNQILKSKIQGILIDQKIQTVWKYILKNLQILQKIIETYGILSFPNQFQVYDYLAFVSNHANKNVRQQGVEVLCSIYDQIGKSLYYEEISKKINKFCIKQVQQKKENCILFKFKDQYEALVENKEFLHYECSLFNIQDSNQEEKAYYWLMEAIIQYFNCKNMQHIDIFIEKAFATEKLVENGKAMQIMMNLIFNYMQSQNQIVVIQSIKLVTYILKKIQNIKYKLKNTQNNVPMFEYVWYLLMNDQNGLPQNQIQQAIQEFIKSEIIQISKLFELINSQISNHKHLNENKFKKCQYLIMYYFNNIGYKKNDENVFQIRGIIGYCRSILWDIQLNSDIKAISINLLGFLQFNVGNDDVEMFKFINKDIEDVDKMKINSQCQKYALIYHQKVMLQEKKLNQQQQQQLDEDLDKIEGEDDDSQKDLNDAEIQKKKGISFII